MLKVHPQLNCMWKMHPQLNCMWKMHPQLNCMWKVHPQLNCMWKMHPQLNCMWNLLSSIPKRKRKIFQPDGLFIFRQNGQIGTETFDITGKLGLGLLSIDNIKLIMRV